MKNFDRKSRTALLSIFSNTMLIILKVVAGILSGSISIISEAIHSSMDLMASLVAFMSVRVSAKPADRDHPYGHGKIENISGMVEGLLIFIAAGLIIFEAVKKISEPMEIEAAGIAIGVMLTAAVVNFFVSRILYKVGKEEDSMALEADALHLKTDIYTSLGVAAGIILIKRTGILVLDSVVAILVALLIIKEAWVLCRNALEFLMDRRLSDIEEQEIKAVIENVKKECGKEIIDFHKLKTRKSGNIRHIDFHITVDPSLTVEAAHEIVGCLKKEICDDLTNTRVSVHIDPYHPQKEHDPLEVIRIQAAAEDKIRNQKSQ